MIPAVRNTCYDIKMSLRFCSAEAVQFYDLNGIGASGPETPCHTSGT